VTATKVGQEVELSRKVGYLEGLLTAHLRHRRTQRRMTRFGPETVARYYRADIAGA
jgi:hypothetical protein